METILERLKAISPRHYLPIGLAVAGVILIGYGLIQLTMSANVRENSPSLSIGSASGENSTASALTASIKVDVEGAIVHPGVYAIASNSRIQDALIAAGGLSQSADRNYVAKNLNLAAKVTDGAKIYIPSLGETITSSPANIAGQSGQIGLVNINTASLTDLDNLPGIGPVTAQKLIAGRPFSTKDELVTRKIVSSKVFDQIKDKISIN